MSLTTWVLVAALWLALAAAQMAAQRLGYEIAQFCAWRRYVLVDPAAALTAYCQRPSRPNAPFECRLQLRWFHGGSASEDVCAGVPPAPADTERIRRYQLALSCEARLGNHGFALPKVATVVMR